MIGGVIAVMLAMLAAITAPKKMMIAAVPSVLRLRHSLSGVVEQVADEGGDHPTGKR